MYVPSPQITPRARDLAARLAAAIREARQDDPALTDLEVRQALHLARREAAGGVAGGLVIALLGGLVALGLAVMLLYRKRGGSLPVEPKWLVLGVLTLLVLVVLVVAVARRRRRQ